MRKIILASQSPWRKILLERAGISFDVEPSDFEEDHTQKLLPRDLVQRLAEGKADTIALRHNNAIVLGADTLVEWNGEVFGKPQTPERAKEMLSALNGNTHPIHTGWCIIDTQTGERRVGVETTMVTFRHLFSEEIDAYVATGEALNVAGAYAIQGGAASFVRSINGDFYNIVGLPLARIVEELGSIGALS